ncbi:uncharacterized protein LOC124490762 [Dermatophagoides farinae]|uniref:Uncharacterized protein n=1 Tax=Dermatophagoides farinae TaxID=6954 RepID=A0A922KWC3_DERFA|nr:uncharacterized protein LOC124490762 [Dermatophagoides farinae]KAH7640057.1 hypothetical protein HUG17_4090 [Dermatophagoides farinae]KAH9493405.1 hypothetical protein DERF_014156 [Dermatophagoides farinae]
MSSIYQKYDDEIGKKNCDYNQLEKEMLNQHWQQDPELAWRLASIVYYKCLNLSNDEEIKLKTIESLRYAEKSIELFTKQQNESVGGGDGNIFYAYKWSAMAHGRLALFEMANVERKILYTANFLQYLDKCLQQQEKQKESNQKITNDHLVLFMQGRFQLALSMLSEDEQKIFQKRLGPNVVIPKLNLLDGESKLRRSIELQPDFIDNYITLAYLLIKEHKILDAKQIIEKGLQQQCCNKSDELIRQELLKIKETLG